MLDYQSLPDYRSLLNYFLSDADADELHKMEMGNVSDANSKSSIKE